MLISVIFAVYNSHVVLNEQLLYMHDILEGFDEQVEVLFVDDGSEPSLKKNVDKKLDEFKGTTFDNFSYVRIDEKIRWNQPAARNLGVSKAKGEILLLMDIDHFIVREMIDEIILHSKVADLIHWLRIEGMLKDGKVIEDENILQTIGLEGTRRKKGSAYNLFAIRKKIFDAVGGYSTNFCGKYGGDDTDFKRKLFKEYPYPITKITGDAVMYHYPKPRELSHLFHDLHQGGEKK